jgi:hypothetical protein
MPGGYSTGAAQRDEPAARPALCRYGVTGCVPQSPLNSSRLGVFVTRNPRLLRRKADKKPVVAALVPKGAAVLRPGEVESVPGPALKAG